MTVTDPLDPWLAKLLPMARHQASLHVAIERTEHNLAVAQASVQNLAMKLQRQIAERERLTHAMQKTML
jgi:hypothetical protein